MLYKDGHILTCKLIV